MAGPLLRSVGVPVVSLFLIFGCYCLFIFWEQEGIAKQLYSWEPVMTIDYEIKKIGQPDWPTDKSSESSEEFEKWVKELGTMQNAMHSSKYNEYTISISYQYEYQGYAGDGNTLSPFYELNTQALQDPQLHRYLLRVDHPPLTVYVDPDRPARSALVRGWAQGDRWGSLVLGGVLLPLSLALLYVLVRPVGKVEELFK